MLSVENEEAHHAWSVEFLSRDFNFNFSVFLLLTILFGIEVLPVLYYCSFILGAMYGACWEITNTLVPNCLRLVSERLEQNHSRCAYVLAHTLSDGFLTFVFYCILSNAFSDPYLLKTNTRVAFFVLVNVQAWLVELAFNGKFWRYGEDVCLNPVLFRRTTRLPKTTHYLRVGYTVWPFFVWVVVGATYCFTFSQIAAKLK